MNGREIKFRAWDNMGKRMLHVPTLYFNDTNYVASTIREHNNFLSVNGESELMQFTGLRDNKRDDEYPEGQEVFEGDVFPDHFNSKVRGVVKLGEYRNPFNDDRHGGHVGFYIEWNGDLGLNRKDLAYWIKVSCVIGNIYDNPELLGDKE